MLGMEWGLIVVGDGALVMIQKLDFFNTSGTLQAFPIKFDDDKTLKFCCPSLGFVGLM